MEPNSTLVTKFVLNVVPFGAFEEGKQATQAKATDTLERDALKGNGLHKRTTLPTMQDETDRTEASNTGDTNFFFLSKQYTIFLNVCG